MTGPATATMGHRSLVAYRRADGTFTIRYAHWGDGLAAAIGPETPLGGTAQRPDVGAVAEDLTVDRRGGYDPAGPTRVDPRPLATGATGDDVLDAVDANHESLVVVSRSYEATSYLVCSLDPTGPGSDLVLASPDGDPGPFRTWMVETKSRLSAAVAGGVLSRGAARATFRRALAARATIYSMDDASFLRDG